ncbi:Zinc finger protein [Rutstroemia sp. NJR-2017a WRK4]|nr:Zinc finger protein [Rutstroemia sp. NJR-2017a WRK4]
MTYYCYPCDRSFVSQNSYNQHVNNSSAHRQSYDYYSEEEPEPEFECDACYSRFYTSKSREQHHAASHRDRYCVPCKRMFMNANNLMQHQHSRAHVGSTLKCPFCSATSATASGVVIHLESGSCSSGVNRQKINAEIRRLDQNHVITNRLLTYPSSSTTTTATNRSWNGYAYECYLCSRQTASLDALNKHLNSPAHEQNVSISTSFGLRFFGSLEVPY